MISACAMLTNYVASSSLIRANWSRQDGYGQVLQGTLNEHECSQVRPPPLCAPLWTRARSSEWEQYIYWRPESTCNQITRSIVKQHCFIRSKHSTAQRSPRVFKMQHLKLFVLCLAMLTLLAVLTPTLAGDKEDTIIMGGDHGCGPKLLLKTSKKKGNILVMNDCKKKKETHYIPYPVYQHYGGGGHEYGGGHGGGY